MPAILAGITDIATMVMGRVVRLSNGDLHLLGPRFYTWDRLGTLSSEHGSGTIATPPAAPRTRRPE